MLELENIVEQIKEKQAEKAQLHQLFNDKVAQLKMSLESKTEQLDKDLHYLTQTARAEFERLPAKVTKTQRKISLLSGDFIVKNATQKLEADKSLLLKLAENEERERIEKYNSAVEELTNLMAKCVEIELRISEEGIDDSLIKEQEITFANRDLAYDKVAKFEEPSFYAAFIKSKTTQDFDWATFKKCLIISEGSVINAETGEKLEIDGLQVIDVPEEVVIK